MARYFYRLMPIRGNTFIEMLHLVSLLILSTKFISKSLLDLESLILL